MAIASAALPGSVVPLGAPLVLVTIFLSTLSAAALGIVLAVPRRRARARRLVHLAAAH